MKKILFIALFLTTGISHAQIINFLDSNFKNTLLSANPGNNIAKDNNGSSITIDVNGDNEIQQSEALLVYILDVSNQNISDVTGIEFFVNLVDLKCDLNSLSFIDISTNINLTSLDCGQNNLTTLDVSNNLSLVYLFCGGNSLSNLDVSNNLNLEYLFCNIDNLPFLDLSNNISLTNLDLYGTAGFSTLDLSNNINLVSFWMYETNFTEIDLSNNYNLLDVYLDDNSLLEYINVKNGNNENILMLSCNILPVLGIVCLDDINSNVATSIFNQVGHPVTFTEYCSFIPGQNNSIVGNVLIDLDVNGCDSNDFSLPNLLLISNNGTKSYGTFTQSDGSYEIYSDEEGTFTTSIVSSFPSYYVPNPSSYTNIFTGYDNTFTADFCIEPTQSVDDLYISLFPLTQARPGFETIYQVVYSNIGTTQLNGNVVFEFDDSKLSYVSASETVSSQTSNSLVFEFTGLAPFETRTIELTFVVFTPPNVNIGDVIWITSTINPITNDITPEDNVFVFEQTVVGSYDPNDITCIEGEEILITQIDDFLHYIIRFQNTGTASAINVVVTNILDDNLDWNTFQIESISHPNRIAITNENEVEFIFENINLPDSTSNEPDSHGYIAYRIKPKNGLGLGDTMDNQADIYFDFNEPISTNTVTTTVVNELFTNDYNNLDILVYPNPSTDVLYIQSQVAISSSIIFDGIGKIVSQSVHTKVIDLSPLSSGLYFLKVEDNQGNVLVKKIIKN